MTRAFLNELGETVKTCNACARTQPIANYGPHAKLFDGRRGDCRRCERKSNNARNAAKPAEVKAEEARRRRAARPEHTNALALKSHFKRMYGLTMEELTQMKQSRAHRCDICRKVCDGTHRAGLYVDHCHSSGIIRGLLCNTCNRTLGYFEDDPTRLRAAAAYLERSKRKEAA